jgi:sugar/nucleoside kinase (ribokinase family)
MKILTLGGATQDIFINYENVQTIKLGTQHEKKTYVLLQEGAKIEINKIRYATGGGATNSAVSFKRLGFNVSSFFKIGADSQGMMVLDALKREGVDVQQCKIDEQEQTGISYIIPSLAGDRTVLAFRGANAHLNKADFSFDIIKSYSYLYITSLSGDSSCLLLPITEYAKKSGVIVATNPGGSQLAAGANILRNSLPFIDILILNRDEAQQLMIALLQTDEKLLNILVQSKLSVAIHAPSLLHNLCTYEESCFNVMHFFQEVSARGPQKIVVTNGAEGVYVYAGKTVYFHPSMPVKSVSTVGAGDAFGSAFVAGLSIFDSIGDAIRGGIVNSTSVITHTDAKEGLLHRDELEKEIKKLDQKLLQKFEF